MQLAFAFTPDLTGLQFASCNIWFGTENQHHHLYDDDEDEEDDIECLWLMLIPVLTGDYCHPKTEQPAATDHSANAPTIIPSSFLSSLSKFPS